MRSMALFVMLNRKILTKNMKKNRIKNVSQAFVGSMLKGLIVFAVFSTALYAYAVSYPTQPNPISGVVGTFVGETGGVYNGANASDYETANGYCDALVADSHVCTPMEMINTYNHNPSALTGETASFWVNNGPPGYISNLNNDCNGWSSSDSATFGSVWNTTKDASFVTSCDLSRAYACCK